MKVLTIAERAEAVRRRVAAACERAGRSPEEVTVVAVAKTFPPAAIAETVAAGVRHIGENRVQEAAAKRPELAGLDAVWHMVGRLQTNKVARALELFDIIQAVDSLHLAAEISKRAPTEVPVFLEVNVEGEATKLGFSPSEALRAAGKLAALPNLDLRGLMTVAPLTDDPEEVRPVFRRLRALRDALGLPELSMGMTDDFEVAIDEGATLVRIGRAIFGERSFR
ncbi:MAG: YggS family pyridoxal phosphate-dependent enzyme [Chloroflexi bacterium]|nr:YggS family pyridoxal phosphate-dependent enzyme [Chloroflexota bacterium]